MMSRRCCSVGAMGMVPPGNAPGVKDWTQGGTRTIKADLRLTPGTGTSQLTCSMEELIGKVVKSHRIVAFIKGTRTDPACGFSFKVITGHFAFTSRMETDASRPVWRAQVLSLLNSCKVDYEVVNVLDEVHNPGLREAIKSFSIWPTIPQVLLHASQKHEFEHMSSLRSVP